jgi:membrane-associated phospholipid phosphatase
MNAFLKIGAWLFHPLLMPLLGVTLYFRVTPRFIIPEMMYSKLLVVFILTFLIPVLLFFLLKTLGLIKSIHLKEVEERRIPLMLQCILFVVVIKMVFEPYHYPELYFFFVGTLFSAVTAFVLVMAKFKVSLHMIGTAGVTMFLIALSIHFKVNTLVLISFLILVNGWVATSRLHSKAHTPVELIFGFFVGFLPQLILLNYWL